jgi:hypothetical protein
MTDSQMTSAELIQARIGLGFSPDILAADLGLPPGVVAAWESGRDRIPAHNATDRRWRAAGAERQRALAASDLPDCEWMVALEAQPLPTKLKARTARLEQLLAHEKVCPTCLARDTFIADRFPPMPPPPIAAEMRALGWAFQQAERLPPWAQPSVPMAMAFGAYSLFRIVFLLPRMVAQPRVAVIALAGFSASIAIGGALGAAYGIFRMGRERLSARRTA